MRKPKANARRGGSKAASLEEAAYAFRRALSSDLSVAGQILGKHPELIDYPVYGKSESALHFFAVENRQDVVSWLIAHGANPKGIAKEDFPLHDAAQLGHRDVCGMLL